MSIKLHNYDSTEAYPYLSKGCFEMSEGGEINDDTEFFDEKDRKFRVNDCFHKEGMVIIEFEDCEEDWVYIRLDLEKKEWILIGKN